MKKIFSAFMCVFLLASGGLSADEILSQSYAIDNIRYIEAGNAVMVEIQQGEEESLQVEASAEVLERIKVDVKGDRLVLGVKKEGGWFNWFGDNHGDVKFVLQIAELRGLQLSGASRASTGRLQTPDLHMDISGASRAEFGTLEVDSLVLKLSGASRAEIKGIEGQNAVAHVSGASRLDVGGTARLEELDINVSGASRYQGARVTAGRAKVEASGASHAELGRLDFLDANASGASNIRYRGKPQVKRHTSGASNIHSSGD